MNLRDQTSREQADRGHRAVPLLEWLAAGTGSVLILGMLGFIDAEAWRANDEAPFVAVEVLRIVERNRGYTVVFRATNVPRSTAAEIEICGDLKEQGRTFATSRASLDYLAGGSSREGGLNFTLDPRRFVLEARALGYAEP